MSFTLTFFTNLAHHHQIPVADEFYKILGNKFRYVITMPLTEILIEGGYDPNINRPYILRAYECAKLKDEADRLMCESDIVIFSYGNEKLLRVRKSENKITFHYSERWLKDNIFRHFMPKELISIYRNYFKFRKKRTYMLCASAFTSKDVKKYFCFPKKCFKWGYMTKVDTSFSLTSQPNKIDKKVYIMWCSRFIDWKHPEMPIFLAKRLKEKCYNFHLDMYGCGIEYDRMLKLSNSLGLNDVLSFCGNLPNELIIKEMRQHEIFLFTSDRREGWGAVANEAMSNGCALIGSDMIGSIPYLVKDGINGLVFKSGSIDSLEEKVLFLLDNQEICLQIRREAIRTMQEVWSPKNAVINFINLVGYIQDNNLNNYLLLDGPASWA